MYSCKNGVSEYISDMEKNSDRGQRLVSGWNADYKMLKHVRWVRNQIAHDTNTKQVSEPEDLEFVRDYYKRIFSGKDSLSLLRKAKGSGKKRKSRKKKKTKSKSGFLLVIFICIALLLLIILLKNVLHF